MTTSQVQEFGSVERVPATGIHRLLRHIAAAALAGDEYASHEYQCNHSTYTVMCKPWPRIPVSKAAAIGSNNVA